MAELKQCEFYLLRYVPDVVKGEFVNLGVVLLETEGSQATDPAANQGQRFTDVRFTRDWRRVRCLDPEADVELLESFESELRRMLQSRTPETINYRGPMSRREWLLGLMRDSFSGSLELAPMTAVLTESPQAEIGKLAKAYLESKAAGARTELGGRRAIYHAMQAAFEAEGVWNSPHMRKKIAPPLFSRSGDSFRIDCGYRPNGTIHLFHAVSLRDGIDSAKLLAFSYPAFRSALSDAEHATCDLRAIVEDGVIENELDSEIQFALGQLHARDIAVAPVSQMGQLAAQARMDLKL